MMKLALLLFSIFLVRFVPTTLHFEIRTGKLAFLFYESTAEKIADISAAGLTLGGIPPRKSLQGDRFCKTPSFSCFTGTFRVKRDIFQWQFPNLW